jgi:hypothetical protein
MQVITVASENLKSKSKLCGQNDSDLKIFTVFKVYGTIDWFHARRGKTG